MGLVSQVSEVINQPRLEMKPASEDSGSTVLLVDDESDLLDLAERVLHKAGFHVISAVSGEEALQRLAERSYDVAVLDLRMPVIGGREIYRAIQESYPRLARHVVFITGDSANDPAHDWLAATGCTILTKPFDIGQLADMVHLALTREGA